MDDRPEALTAREDPLEQLRLELARRETRIAALETELKVRLRWDEDLRRTAENLDARMLKRDEDIAARDEEIAELRRIQGSLLEELEWRRQNERSLQEGLDRLGQDIEHLQAHIAEMESTRLWRAGQRYRRAKASVRRALRRGT